MSNPEGRRARRAILVGLGLFVLVQAALGPAVLRWGLVLRDRPYGHKVARLKERLATGRPVLAVAIGSSRTIFGVRGQEVEPWLSEQVGRPVVLFNMGLTGAGPATNLLNLRRLLDEGIRPDLVLVEVMPRFLGEEQNGELLPQRLPAHRLRHDEMRLLASRAGPDRPDVQREWWLAQAVPVHTYRESLVGCVSPMLLPLTTQVERNRFAYVDASGWVRMPSLSAEQVQQTRAAARIDYEPALHNFHLSAARVADLRETVELAHREGVKVALLLMPEGPTFRGWYPPAVWQQVRAALVRLSHRCRVPLLDLRECVAEDGFFDSHHLYPKGAGLFSRRLAEQIVPLLRPPGGPSSPVRPLAFSLEFS
jgi:hypothetical protein